MDDLLMGSQALLGLVEYGFQCSDESSQQPENISH
jgi:hypothetical protein